MMDTSQNRYQTTAQAYADGVRRLFSTRGAGLASFGLEEPVRIEMFSRQANQLALVSSDLTSAAVERLEDDDEQVRAEAATQLLAKALVDFEISAFLLQAAVEEEQGAVEILERPAVLSLPFEPSLALILGQETLSFGVTQTRPALPTDVPMARAQLTKRIEDILGQIEARSGHTAQLAISGLLAVGVGKIAQAAGIVGMRIAQSLGAAEKVSELFTLFRQFFFNAYEALSALLGPTLTKSAASQVTAWVNDILQGEQFTQLLNKLYETGYTQQELRWMVEESPAGLEEYLEALRRLDQLDQQHQKQLVLIDKMIQVLRFVPAVPAAALPQGQLLLGATYIILCGYVIFAGADYVDAPSFSQLDRIPGPRGIIRSTLGEPAMESAPPESAGAEPPESDADNEAGAPGEDTGPQPDPVDRMESTRPSPPPTVPPVVTPSDAAPGSSMREDQAKSVEPAARGEPAGESALIEEMVRLDLAVPKTPVVVGQTFEIALAIRQPASTALAIDGLDSVHSADGAVYRQADQDLVRYKVRVSAPDCDIETKEYTFLLRAGQDSPPRFFQLTPRRAGELSIVVTAFQEEDLMVAQTRVRIQATVQAVPTAPLSAEEARADLLQEMERARRTNEPDRALQLSLYRALIGPAFSLEDLEELCFLLLLDWDLLEGETKDQKARAMIRYFYSRGDLSQLIQAVKDARPNLVLE